MNRARLVAAVAAILTALLLQATVIGPVTLPWVVSLPAVLVAAVALTDGVAAGMSFGFAAGLVADLGSHHAAGILALSWLGLGLMCGRISGRHRLRRDVLVAAETAAGSTALAALLVVVTTVTGDVLVVGRELLLALLGDLVLAIVLVPLVRRMLGSESLRAPHPVYTELALGPPRV